MKTHKNISLAIGFYIIASVVSFTGIPFRGLIGTPGTYNLAVAILTGILLLIGVMFSLKSNKQKESSWAGNLLGIVGILSIIFTFGALYISSSL